MKQSNFNSRNKLLELVSEYEDMSQKGVVGFFEEAVFFDFVHHYRANNNLTKALQVVEDGLTQHQYSVGLYICKTKLLLDINRHEAALMCLDNALHIFPADETMLRFRSELVAYINLGETSAQKLSDWTLDTITNQAALNEQFANVEDLYVTLKSRLRYNPNDELSLHKIQFCIEINQDYRGSIDFHKEIIDKQPYAYLAWYNLGQAYYCLKDYSAAADAFEYAFLAKPDYVPSYKEYAKVCAMLNDHDRALTAFEDLLTQIEPDTDLLVIIGECYEMKEDYNVSLLFYTKALNIDSQNSYAYYRIGNTFSKQKYWEKAIQAYEKAIERCSQREEYFAALGEAFFQISDYRKAFVMLEKAADMAPDMPILWVQLITFLMNTEQFDGAVLKLEEAKMYCEPNAALSFCKVACWYVMGEKRKARHELMNALNTYYDVHEQLFEYAPDMESDSSVIALINVLNPN